jgi:putative transposase
VVERLDFRAGGLSRRMNRLITRTGRAVLKTRLAALTSKAGIAVETVPSPYSSQECSGCGYTSKTNRPSRSRFRCGFCGKQLHADVNAASVIRSRRSRPLPDHTGPRSRKNTLHLLDTHHRHRWNLPAHGAVPGITGALGQPATTGELGSEPTKYQPIANCIGREGASATRRFGRG